MPKIPTLFLAFALVASADAASIGTFECFVTSSLIAQNTTDYPDGIMAAALGVAEGCAEKAVQKESPFVCDAAVEFPEEYQAIVDDCAGFEETQLVPTAWSICKEQFLPPDDPSAAFFPDVIDIENLPACLSTICDADTDIVATYKSFSSLFAGDLEDDEAAIFNDDLCPTPAPTPAPTTSGSKSFGPSAIASGLLALFVTILAM